MVVISSYDKKYKNTFGGIDKFYLMPYTQYNRSDILTLDSNLIKYPSAYIFEYDCDGSYSQTTELNEGNVIYNQNVSITLSEAYGILDIQKFVNSDFRIVAKTNNGYYLLFGLRNGLSVSASNNSGTSKSEFNGFKLEFNGKEENVAPYFDSLENLGVYIHNGLTFNYSFNFTI